MQPPQWNFVFSKAGKFKKLRIVHQYSCTDQYFTVSNATDSGPHIHSYLPTI